MNFKGKMYEKSGITLIALVVTIIVLLILAGVTIATLTGDNGILTRVKQAKEETEESEDKELIQLAVTEARIGENGFQELNANNLQKAIDNQFDKRNAVVSDNGDGTFTVSIKDKIYNLSSNGNIISEGMRITQAIHASNYGERINYSANGIDDWKIFYNDGNNVFIITSNYISNKNIPIDIGITIKGSHQAYWEKPNTLQYKGSQSIQNSVAERYFFNWIKENSNSENPNMKAVASLFDSNKWKSFVSSEVLKKGGSAIGAPTIEMYIASWNAKGYTKLYCNNINSNGYYIGIETNPTTVGVDMISDTIGYADKLYFPYQESYNECNAYWLASPSAYNNTNLLTVNYNNGYIGTAGAAYQVVGIRPVVCLPSSVIVNKDSSTGCWNIQ